MTPLEPDRKLLRRRLSQYGAENVQLLLVLQQADGCDNAAVEPLLAEILAEESCLKIKDLAVNGHDLMEMGFTGRAIGQCLQVLLDQVLDEQIPNEKTALLQAAIKLKM